MWVLQIVIHISFSFGGVCFCVGDVVFVGITLDGCPRTFDLTSPGNGVVYWQDSTPTLQWGASSDAVCYAVWRDKVNVGGTSTVNCTTSALSTVSHSWYVVAYDVAGNSTQSASTFSFTVSTVPNPKPGDVDSSGEVNIVDALTIARYDAGLISSFVCG